MTAFADVSKSQTDMSYNGELLAHTKLNMRHQVCPGEKCRATISEYTIAIIEQVIQGMLCIM